MAVWKSAVYNKYKEIKHQMRNNALEQDTVFF
jgi:hypothetical protein